MNNRIRVVICLFILVCAAVQVAILNQQSTSGEKVSSLLFQVQSIQKENERLSQEIASSSAIAVVTRYRDSLGLIDHVQVVSLSAPSSLALASDLSLQ